MPLRADLAALNTWNSYLDQVRAKLGDPTFVLGDDTPIVLERFRIVERLDPGEAG